jgi:sugar phosphate isomerase/epimerase
MIEGILTPCRATETKDVEVRLKLLAETVKGFRTGLEVVGPMSDFTYNSKAIVKNLTEARRNGVSLFIIHSPIIRDDYGKNLTNLSRPESLEILSKVFELAEAVGAITVNSHSEVFFTTEEMKALTDIERNFLKKEISENLRKLEKGTIKFTIENIPWPLMGDVFFCEKNMVWDPLFVDPIELYQFCEENNLFMTFDTCHWATLRIPIPLLKAFRGVEKRAIHLHLSDVYGRWLPGTATFKEGLIPGEGNLGEENFRQLLQYLKDCSQPFTLTVEVNDRDFQNPEESRESLRRVLNWLS